jgi:FdhD protein
MQVDTLENATLLAQQDWLAVEEPLEIRLAGPAQAPVSVAVTMRTPGHDHELTMGFLYAEGLVSSREAVVAVETATLPWSGQPCNVVTVRLTQAFDPDTLQRNFFATSSCGVCGKASLEQLAVTCPPIAAGPIVAPDVLSQLPLRLRQQQHLFAQTGGLHAAGLFDSSGQLMSLHEDVGRHNAVDKVVGQILLAGGVPLRHHILLVSGRTSFEILQKAAMAGVPIVCAVSAPSSLAVAVARRFGITLIGFLRDHRCNVYTHPERLALRR